MHPNYRNLSIAYMQVSERSNVTVININQHYSHVYILINSLFNCEQINCVRPSLAFLLLPSAAFLRGQDTTGTPSDQCLNRLKIKARSGKGFAYNTFSPRNSI